MFENGKYCCWLTDTVGEAVTGGLMTSRCVFLFVHRKMPEDRGGGGGG